MMASLNCRSAISTWFVLDAATHPSRTRIHCEGHVGKGNHGGRGIKTPATSISSMPIHRCFSIVIVIILILILILLLLFIIISSSGIIMTIIIISSLAGKAWRENKPIMCFGRH